MFLSVPTAGEDFLPAVLPDLVFPPEISKMNISMTIVNDDFIENQEVLQIIAFTEPNMTQSATISIIIASDESDCESMTCQVFYL